MSSNCSAVWLLLGVSGVSGAQTADLRVLSSASPSTDLAVGQEIVITATAINHGPDLAQDVVVLWGAPEFQPFVLEDPLALTPGCTLEYFDFEPPTFNFAFSTSSLSPGEQRTCAVRVRVRVVPADHQLLVGADVFSGQSSDLVASNNTSLHQLTFATPRPLAIPTLSMWGLIAIAAGGLCLGSIYRSGGRP